MDTPTGSDRPEAVVLLRTELKFGCPITLLASIPLLKWWREHHHAGSTIVGYEKIPATIKGNGTGISQVTLGVGVHVCRKVRKAQDNAGGLAVGERRAELQHAPVPPVRHPDVPGSVNRG
jgi:hypothetical protein